MDFNIDMSTNNKCDICMPEGLDYCITNEELSGAIDEAKSYLLTVIRDLENNTYSKEEIDQLIANIEAGVVDLSDYYTKTTIDAKLSWVYEKLEEITNKIVNIDEDLSSTSTNPVQNKTLYYKFKEYYNKDQVDELISSSGGNINVDSYLSSTSTNPVQNKVITEGLLALRSDVNDLQRQVGNIDTILNSVLHSL